MKYLITGFSGFVSAHFVKYLSGAEKNVSICGLDIVEPAFDFKNYKNVSLSFLKVDLLDKNKVKKIILKFQPNFILHLASLSSVAFSWQNPIISFNNNNNIFLNILEAVRETGIKCRILSVGSSEEYGLVQDKDIPLTESSPLNPTSPYAVARVSQELLSKIYFCGYGIDIIMTRSFNHVGPGQREMFAVPSFAKQMVEMKKKNRHNGSLRVGNTEIVRDFLDVRDVVKAYYLLFQRGKAGKIYNVCGGRGISLKELINLIADYLKIKVALKVDRSLVRPNDNTVVIGDNKKIKEELGWWPTIPLEESIADICDYWMKK